MGRKGWDEMLQSIEEYEHRHAALLAKDPDEASAAFGGSSFKSPIPLAISFENAIKNKPAHKGTSMPVAPFSPHPPRQGKFSTATGQFDESTCQLCPADSYQDQLGAFNASFCKACPANTFALPGSTDITNCSCIPGYTGPDGRACTSYLVGKYKKVSGSAECLLCEEGTYVNITAATSCVSCPRAASAAPGASEISNCTCIPGYEGPDGQPCSNCGPGTYKDINGSSPCLNCGVDTYSDRVVKMNCMS